MKLFWDLPQHSVSENITRW